MTTTTTTLREFTLRGLVLGALITVVFTAANVYLGLKVGLTFASAIPAAVMSMALLRKLPGANILENNLVQTQASAAGTLSSVIFVIPGLIMVGHWAGFPYWQTALLCAAGGALGVLYTVPLRRVMVVQSSLPYPEGVAAAEVLKVGNAPLDPKTGRSAAGDGLKDILGGGLVAAGFGLLSGGFKWLGESINGWFTAGSTVFRLATGFSPALVAAGYMMGLSGGIAILLGLVLSWGVLVPWLTAQQVPEAGQALSQLATRVWASEVRFVGAGLIGIAAIWTVLTLLKPIAQGMRQSLQKVSLRDAADPADSTDRDMPMRWMAAVGVAVFVVLTLLIHHFLSLSNTQLPVASSWALTVLCVLFVFVFGFLIAAACGYMAGLVGSSASPISGIGIVGVILVSLMILLMQQLAPALLSGVPVKLALALVLFSVSVIMCVAAISNDNLQDLKTGYLVGATPWRQQVVLLVGVVVGGLVIPPVLELLYNAYGFPGALPRADMRPEQALSAPQATLMTAVATGIFERNLNWSMVLTGVGMGAVIIVLNLLLKRAGKMECPPLAVGMGLYLPPTIGMTLFLGAVLGWWIDRALVRRAATAGEDWLETARRRGTLIAAGLIVGESLFGILLAGLIGFSGRNEPLALGAEHMAAFAPWLGLLAFVLMCGWYARRVLATPQGTAR